MSSHKLTRRQFLAGTLTSHDVFTTIRQLNPLFFLHMGDMHYLDISANNRDLFRAGYERVLGAPIHLPLIKKSA